MSERKPPLGVRRRDILDEERLVELESAILRRVTGRFQMKPEWIEEYNELVSRLDKEER